MPDMEIEVPKHEGQGDFSTNYAMVSAKLQKMAPRAIAQALVDAMPSDEAVEKVEIAGPGFINFFLSKTAWHPVVDQVLSEDERFGSSDMGKGESIQVEFVSANPTGAFACGAWPWGAVGDSVGNILSFAGFNVQKEYYINDSGGRSEPLGPLCG